MDRPVMPSHLPCVHHRSGAAGIAQGLRPHGGQYSRTHIDVKACTEVPTNSCPGQLLRSCRAIHNCEALIPLAEFRCGNPRSRIANCHGSYDHCEWGHPLPAEPCRGAVQGVSTAWAASRSYRGPSGDPAGKGPWEETCIGIQWRNLTTLQHSYKELQHATTAQAIPATARGRAARAGNQCGVGPESVPVRSWAARWRFEAMQRA